MVDQINTAKNSAPVSSSSQLPSIDLASPIADSANRAPKPNRVSGFRRTSLRTKATAIALAIGTLPVLGIGAISYYFADKAVKEQIVTMQQSSAVGLSDKLNRFMLDRYGDVQVLARLPVLNNAKLKEVISVEEKQAVLTQVVDTYNIYESVAVMDLDGNPILQSKGEKLPNQRDKAYFQAVFRGDSPYIERNVASSLEKDAAVYIAAPVRDSVTGKTIAIVRTVIPLQRLEDVIQDFQTYGRDYDVADSTGKLFLATNKKHLGEEGRSRFPGLDRLQSNRAIDSFVTVDPTSNAEALVSYAPPMNLEGLPSLDWEVMLASDTATAFAPQRGLAVTLAVGTWLTTLLVGAIAAAIARRATRPVLEATEAVEKLGQGALTTRIKVVGDDELASLGFNINQMAEQLQNLLQRQSDHAMRTQLLSNIIVNVRKSLNFDDILQTSVSEVREFLKVDRVVIYRFHDDWLSGTITAESVVPGWVKALGKIVDDPLALGDVDRYRTGQVWAVEDVQNADLTLCHCEILERLEVKANIVAPILRNQELIGLICAHQCANTRKWTPEEIDFFTQLATQIGFALDQASLLEQANESRQQAEDLSEERRQQKEDLQFQLLNLLGEVEGAVHGDLTVRADVTAGEIGTVADFFNSIVESLRQIVTQVKQAATQVNDALGSDEQSVRTLSEQATQQAEETTRTLNSVEAMVRSIQAVSDSALQAADVARTASETAAEGGMAMDLTVHNILSLRETIGETAKKVKRLGESSQQISRVVSLINQIALQTNLLAINAGIEAARAGEESQGFAVVAEEVGELAARSAAATREIEQIVATIQRETSEVVDAMEAGTTQVVEGTRLVGNAKQSLEQILAVSLQIDDLVRSISDATVSQVETSQAVTSLMQDVVEVAGRTSNSSLQVSRSLRQTVEVARELQFSVETFKVN
ncbi:HAMP domain-containing protein [Phormidesmis priestleyi ULC007]|uniref:HAMP domain-containing protein n=1 Tax=Phormidesmis priestleyi ULC007 TaxID=1920490 RepID=A0A2T1DLF6_9CYAN|nr:methyl-accepting chemotaxis protein [Phormidesmis priestleyi]PSB21281.1 HAMP domain-containing protein [Phormidesmis priestleyi ULC007]PZO50652.1 MAG: HAMP domain-containing protein [Phormidesmis priestleyi]